MGDAAFLELTLASAADLVRRGELSPVALAEAYLDRIARVGPRINAYITLTAERAREDARRAEAEIAAGRWRGPLHGLPIALKDLYATRGIRTTAGSKVLADWVPDVDCTVVRRLSEAGVVLLGKLSTHEMAMGVTNDNPHYGPVRNPWDLARIPGGSSGGSAAAVAANLALATMGSDTAGSIRTPASLCGVVGLKPTYGRVSKAGVLALSWSYDHAGPLSRTVRDAALMLQAIAGYDPADATSVRAPVDNYVSGLDGGLAGLRVGVPRAYFFERADADLLTAVEAAIDTLRTLGAEVREVSIPYVAERLPYRRVIVWSEAQAVHAEALRERLGDFGADLRAMLTLPMPSGPELIEARRQGALATEALRGVLEEVDVLVTPTTPVPATPIGDAELTHADGSTETVLSAMVRYTSPFNQSHLPALSQPCGFTRAGLPIGLQIAGRPFDEATVLRVGHAYEQATDWHLRRPPDPAVES